VVKKDIASYSLDKLTAQLLQFEVKKYRSKQVYEWLHDKKVVDFAEMSNIPLSLRTKLNDAFYINDIKIARKLESSTENTVKYLYRLMDGNYIETVLMDYKHGNSLCISTQVGCRMGCRFCASGESGFVRNLAPSEMLSQIYETQRESGAVVNSVVLMGIGEPLDNFDNTIDFLKLLSFETGKNMSLRRVSLSTCGLVPEIYKLAELRLGLTLSVSLHAYNDEKRNRLMPVNKKYNISELMKSCKYYAEKTGRRISFEYAVIAGENNSEEDADGLLRLLSGINCHVNLIPVNQAKEQGFKATKKDCEDFLSMLSRGGLNVTIRRTLGADINAACGQLRGQLYKKPLNDM